MRDFRNKVGAALRRSRGFITNAVRRLRPGRRQRGDATPRVSATVRMRNSAFGAISRHPDTDLLYQRQRQEEAQPVAEVRSAAERDDPFSDENALLDPQRRSDAPTSGCLNSQLAQSSTLAPGLHVTSATQVGNSASTAAKNHSSFGEFLANCARTM